MTVLSSVVLAPHSQAAGSRAVIFLVDTSGSMAGTKLGQAKSALNASVNALSQADVAGLQNFGGNCGDGGTLQVPPSSTNRTELHEAIDGLSASGGTPTTDALELAAANFPSAATEKILVLVSDGESTCGDPCPTAKQLHDQLGISFTAYTVGFQTSGQAETELSCIADATGGKYFAATDTEGIRNAINAALGSTPVACPALGQSISATLRKYGVYPDPEAMKPYMIEYGNLPLTFTSVELSPGASCSVQSNNGSLPVNLVFGAPPLGFAVTIGTSTTQAKLDFFRAPSSEVPSVACNFAELKASSGLDSVPTPAVFGGVDKCFLNAARATAGGVVVRWTIPGFTEEWKDPTSTVHKYVFTTRSMEFYVDLTTLLNSTSVASVPFADLVDLVENYIHVTLVNNLPHLMSIAAVQDPPAHLTVQDPLGRTIGFSRGSQSYAGTGYVEQGNHSAAWIVNPAPGRYVVTASGQPRSSFQTEFSVSQLLGHGDLPLTSTVAWSSRLSNRGTATRSFTVPKVSSTPTLRLRVAGCSPSQGIVVKKANATVTYSLRGSTFPLGVREIRWNFGDQKQAVGLTAKHKFRVSGRYLGSVTVIDQAGQSTTVNLPTIVVRAHHSLTPKSPQRPTLPAGKATR
ncbi:VWA domain-containing protein [Acrocarpospora pleiomorpha]|uniref:VWA domain-containing protein n=1 Tax=Acrocarpospora pleiomorpha TaxID=90975 RepID=UPI001478A150|nr:VWA domain-containing protein [Acrocarpospora pleiomorpha]